MVARPSLHREDLALASACAEGDEAAWERFVREFRPILYRAADALDPQGRARELADALYAELYGLKERGGERQSLFRYYQGRSSLATWLRAVLAQRHIDRIRAERRFDPLPEEESGGALSSRSSFSSLSTGAAPEPDRSQDAARFERALGETLSQLDARERLRLGCYYAQEMTLADTGRILGESEATSSRQLARTRRRIREDVERRLRAGGLDDAEVGRCFETVTEDAGSIDLTRMLQGARKKPEPDRSI